MSRSNFTNLFLDLQIGAHTYDLPYLPVLVTFKGAQHCHSQWKVLWYQIHSTASYETVGSIGDGRAPNLLANQEFVTQ